MIDFGLAVIPNRSFVVTQSLVVGIPIVGNVERWRCFEVVLDAAAKMAGFVITENPRLLRSPRIPMYPIWYGSTMTLQPPFSHRW